MEAGAEPQVRRDPSEADIPIHIFGSKVRGLRPMPHTPSLVSEAVGAQLFLSTRPSPGEMPLPRPNPGGRKCQQTCPLGRVLLPGSLRRPGPMPRAGWLPSAPPGWLAADASAFLAAAGGTGPRARPPGQAARGAQPHGERTGAKGSRGASAWAASAAKGCRPAQSSSSSPCRPPPAVALPAAPSLDPLRSSCHMHCPRRHPPTLPRSTTTHTQSTTLRLPKRRCMRWGAMLLIVLLISAQSSAASAPLHTHMRQLTS